MQGPQLFHVLELLGEQLFLVIEIADLVGLLDDQFRLLFVDMELFLL